MNSERHLVANTYGTVSSNSEDIETVSNSLGGDSDDKPAAAENLVPLNISLRRAPPLYNETITTNRLPVVDRAMDQPEGATALSGEEDSMKVHDLAGYNPFNEFIIQGYENVTEEQSKCDVYYLRASFLYRSIKKRCVSNSHHTASRCNCATWQRSPAS